MRIEPQLAKFFARCFVAWVVLLTLGGVQARDTSTGQIFGAVRDSVGVPVEGVKLTLRDESGRVTGTAMTSSTGNYLFDGVAAGRCQVSAQREGYRPVNPVTIDRSPGQKTEVNLVLQPLADPATERSTIKKLSDTMSYYQSSSLEADEVVGAVDPAGYSSPGDSNTTARLLGGAASLRQESAAGELQPAAPTVSNEQIIFNRGADLLTQSKVPDALKVFNSGLERYPRSANLWIGQGIALYLHGNYDQAVQSLAQATDVDPTAYRPYVFLADVYGTSSKESAAVRERLKRFSELYPQDARAVFYWALCQWRAGVGTEPQNMPGKVESLLKKSISLDPNFADAYLQLGALYASQNRYAEAIEQYHQTIARDPGSAVAHYKLGQALARTGRHEEAAREFKTYETLHQQSGSNPAMAPGSQQQIIDLVKQRSDPTH